MDGIKIKKQRTGLLELIRNSDRKAKYTVVLVSISVLLLSLFLATIILSINRWSAKNEIITQSPITVTTRKAIYVKAREPLIVISPMVEDDTEYEALIGVEKMICDKWGMYECKTAIAIAKAESGLRPEALNHNTNSTYDVGIFQINSIHWEKCGGLKHLLEPANNIECAYSIWSEQGWTPWTVFNTGAFKSNL